MTEVKEVKEVKVMTVTEARDMYLGDFMAFLETEKHIRTSSISMDVWATFLLNIMAGQYQQHAQKKAQEMQGAVEREAYLNACGSEELLGMVKKAKEREARLAEKKRLAEAAEKPVPEFKEEK